MIWQEGCPCIVGRGDHEPEDIGPLYGSTTFTKLLQMTPGTTIVCPDRWWYMKLLGDFLRTVVVFNWWRGLLYLTFENPNIFSVGACGKIVSNHFQWLRSLNASGKDMPLEFKQNKEPKKTSEWMKSWQPTGWIHEKKIIMTSVTSILSSWQGKKLKAVGSGWYISLFLGQSWKKSNGKTGPHQWL